MCGIRWKKNEIEHPEPAVYCANHFSYWDIPSLFVSVPGYFSIIGKSDITSIPLFGYMFKKLYISVNRSNGKNRYQAYEKGIKVIEEGRSLVIYPEGGIKAKNPPEMLSFKDGAFKIAIEKQIPLVPVTIPYNWIILRDRKPLRIKRHRTEVIFHDPISTKGMTIKDLEALKNKVFHIIQKELDSKNTYENR